MNVIIDSFKCGNRYAVETPVLASLYSQGQSLSTIGAAHGMSGSAVRGRLLRAGVDLRGSGPPKGNANARRHEVRERFFEKIDNELAAWMYADATIFLPRKRGAF